MAAVTCSSRRSGIHCRMILNKGIGLYMGQKKIPERRNLPFNAGFRGTKSSASWIGKNNHNIP